MRTPKITRRNLVKNLHIPKQPYSLAKLKIYLNLARTTFSEQKLSIFLQLKIPYFNLYKSNLLKYVHKKYEMNELDTVFK